MGRHALRIPRSPAHRHPLLARNHPLPPRAPAADPRLHRRLRRHLAHHAALPSSPRSSAAAKLPSHPQNTAPTLSKRVSVMEVMSEAAPPLPDSSILPDVYAFTDETSRAAAEKMAAAGLSSLVVLDRPTNVAIGIITLSDLLRGPPTIHAARNRSPPPASSPSTANLSPVRRERAPISSGLARYSVWCDHSSCHHHRESTHHETQPIPHHPASRLPQTSRRHHSRDPQRPRLRRRVLREHRRRNRRR